MKTIQSGVIAGLFATVAVSMLMMLKAATHQFPELHVIRTLSGVIGQPDNLVAGFGAHLLVGSLLWGGLFALLENRLPVRSYAWKGLLFGIAAWLMMMIIFMPLAGAGIFAIHRGTWMIPMVTLAYHLVFGLVLGNVYGSNMPSAKYSNKQTG